MAELRKLPDLEVELFAFRSLGTRAYVQAARDLRRRYRDVRFDVVHTHFGLSIWPALAVRGPARVATLHGTDLVHPRSRAITLAGLPLVDIVAPVSAELARLVPPRLVRGRLELLPCGVELARFGRIDRSAARRALGLDEGRRYLLFPSDPDRPEKRVDRAREVAGEHTLLVLKGVAPEDVTLWINAADAVLVPSERESFGLAMLEALACDVPVLATPVGVAPEALSRVPGTLCAPFERDAWSGALARVLEDRDPRVRGREVAEDYSAAALAQRVAAAWSSLS